MRLGEWVRPPRHLLVFFVGITSVSAVALGWSGWQLVRQDRALAAQRAQERRDDAVSRATDRIQRLVGSLESQLAIVASVPPAAFAERAQQFGLALPHDSVLVALAPDNVTAYPAERLLFYPAIRSPEHPLEFDFSAADAAEFRDRDTAKATAVLRAIPASAPALVRAEVWLRLARNFRKAQRWQDAVDAYERLQELGDLPVGSVGDVPAGLVARLAAGELLAERGQRDRLGAHARLVANDLRTGRWRLKRAAYDDAMSRVGGWLDATRGQDPPQAARHLQATPALILSEAVHQLWTERQDMAAPRSTSSRVVGDASVVVVEHKARDLTLAVLTLPATLLSSATDSTSSTGGLDSRVVIADADGRSVAGGAIPTSDFAVRVGATTGLPWTVYATTVGESPGRFTSRAVGAGLSAILLLVAGGSYLIGRAVLRELRVARMQSDFVSAVSHEFRTPLTAITQMSDLLASERVASEALRRQYYDVLQVESGRLHRLVEGLLRFGRMEAGALPMRFELRGAFEFVDEVVGEFGREASRQGYQAEVERIGESCVVRMDREALACALWNLLDNAMKYSPTCRTIWVTVDCRDARVRISVRDMGVGVADADRARIFDKFVRGDVASTLGVRGTGIGLAIARQIVVWHGGTIGVERAPGEGSIFTIALPAAEGSGT